MDVKKNVELGQGRGRAGEVTFLTSFGELVSKYLYPRARTLAPRRVSLV